MHELGVADSHAYVYVLASGTAYLARKTKLIARLRRAARYFEGCAGLAARAVLQPRLEDSS